MKNRIIRKIDSQGRVTIPGVLIELAHLNTKRTIALVAVGKDMISIMEYEDIKEEPILYKTTMDSKNRIIIPKYLRDGIKEVEIFLYKDYITLK